MSVKEKDKLLLRLIAKDTTLTDRLNFELIEESSTIDERKEEIKSRIERASRHQDTPGWLLMDMRNLSGEINYHIKVTKDKMGGIELNLFLLLTFIEKNENLLSKYSSRSDTCALYIAKKANTILNALNKLDADYLTDFLSDANKMLQYVHRICSKVYARQLELPESLEI